MTVDQEKSLLLTVHTSSKHHPTFYSLIILNYTEILGALNLIVRQQNSVHTKGHILSTRHIMTTSAGILNYDPQ